MLNWIWIGLILIALMSAGAQDLGLIHLPEAAGHVAEKGSRMAAVTEAAFDSAKTAVNIVIGLIGIMAMWLGLMRLADKAGLVQLLARVLKPVLRRLFPDVPDGHPALGAMVMNIAANMLGLGNAATPLGLKAMEELDKLNPRKGTATNAMCTFLAINTAGLTLIPATVLGILAAAGSKAPYAIISTTLIASGVATITAIIAAKILERLPIFRVPRDGEGPPPDGGPDAGKDGSP
ncbi:MAG TPA: nucleoside recognition domain-containing protein [Verrucomicrobiae bacterium]|nr:nucleoside recognition domain-containing protein [Verrucomicrobiae bacterium]